MWSSAQPEISGTAAGSAFVELSCRPGAWVQALGALVGMPEVVSVDAAAAVRLGADPRIRVLASVTGRANLLVVMWLSSVAEVLAAEQTIQEQVPGIEIQQSVVSLRPVKRLGWVLDAQGRCGDRFVAPQIHLA